jgi:hypothetical protein
MLSILCPPETAHDFRDRNLRVGLTGEKQSVGVSRLIVAHYQYRLSREIRLLGELLQVQGGALFGDVFASAVHTEDVTTQEIS